MQVKSEFPWKSDMPLDLDPVVLSDAAKLVLDKRYRWKDAEGNFVETYEEMFWRVAWNIAQAEQESHRLYWARQFYEIMASLDFLPNSPTLANAGRDSACYSACFVIPIEDSMKGIYKCVSDNALVQKNGGGVGTDFTPLRARGSYVAGTGGEASGPVSFMRVINYSTDSVKQGALRRGANMGLLSVHHPDILEFVNCKSKLDSDNLKVFVDFAKAIVQAHNPPDADVLCEMLSEICDWQGNPMPNWEQAIDRWLSSVPEAIRVQAENFMRTLLDTQFKNFNISVAVTDEFMKALEEDQEYNLYDKPYSHDRRVVGKLRAQTVWNNIIVNAWRNGDPGVIFIDTVNKDNTLRELYGPITACNPCVTGDVLVMTALGPKRVLDLLGSPCDVYVNGKLYHSSTGFFSTGVKPVFKVTTRKGYSFKATGNHLVKVKRRGNNEWVPVSELSCGDKVVLADHGSITWEGAGGSFEEGWLLGQIIGNGGILKDGVPYLQFWGDHRDCLKDTAVDMIRQLFKVRADFKGKIHRSTWVVKASGLKELVDRYCVNNTKQLARAVEETSSSFHVGFLRGLFDSDGSVQGDQDNGMSIRLSSTSLDLLAMVQRMLLRLGIVSAIYRNRRDERVGLLPDGQGGLKSYRCKACHELAITKSSMRVFADRVGLYHPDKKKRLEEGLASYKRGPYGETFTDTILSVEPVGEEQVYDIVVEDVHEFDANGVCVHNCGEQPLFANESCNLGSINLRNFVIQTWNGSDKPCYAWSNRLVDVVKIAVRFLDDVIDVNHYPLHEISEKTQKTRKIGLGIMGLADALILLGKAYNSEEGRYEAQRVMARIQEAAHEASRELACEKGAYKAHSELFSVDGIYIPPIQRNAAVTTIAPTGTISMIAGCSSGIEPLFGLGFTKTVMDGTPIPIVSPAAVELLQREGLYTEDLMAKIASQGTTENLGLPENIRAILLTAGEIAPEDHVKMQAAIQKFVDNAISKTVNMPNSATVQDVDKIYRLAYELGCKGITIYRDGSKSSQILTMPAGRKNLETIQTPQAIEPVVQYMKPRKRPDVTYGLNQRIAIGCGKCYVQIFEDDMGMCEIFTTVGKNGGCASAMLQALSIVISHALRAGMDPAEIASNLRGIRCPNPCLTVGGMVLSCPDAMGIAIQRYQDMKLQDPGGHQHNLQKAIAKVADPLVNHLGVCAECGAAMVDGGGCPVCPICGFSRCG